VLGALQGLLGWTMVQSGLVEDPRVSHFRLTAHLGVALAIFAAELWIALALIAPARGPSPARRRVAIFAAGIAGLVFVQALTGGFVAGLRAGRAYNTFPLMNGALVPPEWLMLEPWWNNFLYNMATVQLVHRTLAWLLLALVATLWWRLRGTPARTAASALLAAIAAQFALGVATLLTLVSIPLAALHQAGAVVVLGAALWTAHRARLA
jgi:cytochrome c oxidase assembly protein subunit 15